MKLVVVGFVALLAGCGGSAKPTQEPGVEPTTRTSDDSPMTIEAAGFNDEGIKAMNAGNYALATEQFRQAVARVPVPVYFFNLCTSLFQEGKFPDAMTACSAVDKNEPTSELSEKTRKLIARIEAEANKHGLAPDVVLDPTPTATGSQAAIAAKLNDEGVELMFKTKFAEATAKFREAVARVPEAKYFFNLCTALYQEGKFSEGLTACNGGKKNQPDAKLDIKIDAMIKRIKDEAKAQNVPVQMSP